MRRIELPGGESVAALGQGTWRLGETPAQAAEETSALRAGIDLGMNVIDTAEMYGEGATESFLGTALAGLRDAVFLVSKAYPQNAGRARLARACDATLKRLKTDRLDLYLLHWRGTIPLAETVEAMQALQAAGKIRHWGVSNFDERDMIELSEAGTGCVTNQILYNPSRRGSEFDLIPWMTRHDMPVMAYSPIEQGRLGRHPVLRSIASRHGAEPLQIALAWVLSRPATIAIPKAANLAHMRQNRAALDLVLSPEDRAELEAAFPPPRRKTPLAML